jgi:carbamoyl-phosphate synthase large subunit
VAGGVGLAQEDGLELVHTSVGEQQRGVVVRHHGRRHDVDVLTGLEKIHEGLPHVLDLVLNREVRLIINTPSGKQGRGDDRRIRSSAVAHKIPCITTLSAAAATIQGLEWIAKRPLDVTPLQEYHAQLG